MERTQTIVASDDSIVLSIPADGRWVGLLRLAIAGIGNELDYSTEVIDDLKLAITEAAQHAIATAGAAARISAALRATPHEMSFTVTLDGARSASEPIGEDGDVGLFVLRAIADDVQLTTSGEYTLVVRKAT